MEYFMILNNGKRSRDETFIDENEVNFGLNSSLCHLNGGRKEKSSSWNLSCFTAAIRVSATPLDPQSVSNYSCIPCSRASKG